MFETGRPAFCDKRRRGAGLREIKNKMYDLCNPNKTKLHIQWGQVSSH